MLNENISGHFGAINVPLAVFWSDFNEEYKEISRQAAFNTSVWSENLTIDERLWLVGKVDTTALFGERVKILECKGEWVKVAAVSQPTRQNDQGYPGWVLANQVSCDSTYLREQLSLAEAVVCVPKTTLFSESKLTKSHSIISYQTRLPILSKNDLCIQIRLPDGTAGYLHSNEIKSADEIYFSGQAIIQEAQQFLDLKYLWGGTTSWGFDCSGFMFRLYQSQGLTIPRDASEQAAAGVEVAKENLQPGDLLFFAKDKLFEKIHHVGMYIGNGQMIHSPNSKSSIRIEAIEAGVYGEEYWGARRYY
jgi:hypothetical protein